MNTLWLFGLIDVRPCHTEIFLKFNSLTDFSPEGKEIESERSHSPGDMSSTPRQCLYWIPRSPPFPSNTLPSLFLASPSVIINGKLAAVQAVLLLPLWALVIFYSEPEVLPIVSC